MNRKIGTTVILLAASLASAQPHGGDVVLATEGGRIVTLIDEGSGLKSACTYESEFELGDFTDEPGFDSESGALPANSDLGFTINRALRVWDGAGFDTIPGERIEISWGPLGPVTSPTEDIPVDGFTLGVSSNGEFHYHYDFGLTGPAAPGVYLLSLTLWSDHPDLEASEPLFIVFNKGMDEAVHEEAIDWWLANGAWCGEGACIADFNGDGTVDTRDFVAYLGAWSASDPESDINGDGEIDTRDFIAYLGLWSAGC